MRNMMRRMVVSVLTVSLLGCATHTRTIQTEQTVRYPTERSPIETGERASEKQVVVEKETTTQIRHEPYGVLSTVVHVVGEILALPFRLIGGLIRLIF